MIFIAFFLFIALIAVSLNLYNSSNLSTIEEHLKASGCIEYIYSKGSYKSLCEDKILEVSNSFIVDLENNSKEYKYKEIKKLQIDNLDIVMNENKKVSFKTKEDLELFYEKLQNKLKK